MKITRDDGAGSTILEISGNIVLGESAKEFAKALQEVLDETSHGVVLDLAEIDYVDSTGIGEFVGYLQRFGDAGRRLALLNPQHRIEALLELMGLEKLFPIFRERAAAVTFASGS